MKNLIPSSFHVKRLTGLFFYALLIALFAMGASCRNTEGATETETDTAAEAIQRILLADEQLAEHRNYACKDTTLSATIRQYVAGIDRLDFSDCPDDFTAAFRRHRDAWAASVDFFSQFDDRRGEMHELFAAIEAEGGQQQAVYEAALQPIMDTWTPVDSLARQYGALPEMETE